MRISHLAVGAMALALSSHAVMASDVSDREDLATRMIAVGMFVDQTCPHMSLNKYMLASAITKLDVDLKALSKKQGRMNQVEVLNAGWQANQDAACATAWSLYGADGSVLPGMIEKE